MYYQQQQPTYQQLVQQHSAITSQINTLRQAMARAANNPQIQNDYAMQINQLTQDLNNISAMLRSMAPNNGVQNTNIQTVPQVGGNYISPVPNVNNNIGYQQMNTIPQQNFATNTNSIMFNTVNNSVNNQSESKYSGAGDRYNRRNTSNNNISSETYISTQNTETPPVVKETPKNPLFGNEYKPLTADGVTVEVINLGDFYKYSYKGKEMIQINENEILVKGYNKEDSIAFVPKINNEVVNNDINIFLKAQSLENNKKIVCIDAVEWYETIIEKDSDLLHFELLEDIKDLNDLRENIIKVYNNGKTMEKEYLLNVLNTEITNDINNILLNIVGMDVTIDSFIEDYEELINYVNELDSERRRSVESALKAYTNSIRYTNEMKDFVTDGDSCYNSDKYKTISTLRLVSVVYLDKSLECIDDTQFKNNTLMITKDSAPSLYNILVKCKDSLLSKDSNYLKIVYDDKNYTVYYNSETEYFTIKK